MSDTFTGLIDPVDQNLFVLPNFEEAGGDTVTTSHHLRLWVKNLSHIRLPNTYYQQVVAVAVLLLLTFLVAAVALISAIALRGKASPSRATTRLQPLVIYFLCHLGFTLHYLVYLWYGYSGLKFDASLEYWGALISSYWLWVFLATWITAVDNLYRAQTFMNTHAKDYRLRSGLLYRPLVRVFVCVGLPVCLIASVIGVTVPLNKKWSSVYREAESFDRFMTLVSDIGEPPSIDFQRAAVVSLWQRWSRVWWLVSVAYGIWSAWSCILTILYFTGGYIALHKLDKQQAQTGDRQIRPATSAFPLHNLQGPSNNGNTERSATPELGVASPTASQDEGVACRQWSYPPKADEPTARVYPDSDTGAGLVQEAQSLRRHLVMAGLTLTPFTATYAATLGTFAGSVWHASIGGPYELAHVFLRFATTTMWLITLHNMVTCFVACYPTFSMLWKHFRRTASASNNPNNTDGSAKSCRPDRSLPPYPTQAYPAPQLEPQRRVLERYWSGGRFVDHAQQPTVDH